jgi:hypothetical protein
MQSRARAEEEIEMKLSKQATLVASLFALVCTVGIKHPSREREEIAP